jgi:hypothetical protein
MTTVPLDERLPFDEEMTPSRVSTAELPLSSRPKTRIWLGISHPEALMRWLEPVGVGRHGEPLPARGGDEPTAKVLPGRARGVTRSSSRGPRGA